MKRLLYFLMIISLIGCVTKENFKTIILKTTGYIEVKPDEASIQIQINCIDKNLEIAKNCLLEKSNGLIATLTQFGIQAQDILTTRVDLNKDFIWQNNSYVFNGYSASTSANVMIRDLKVLETLYPELLSNDQLTIGGLTYQHSKIDSLNEMAYLNALDNANKLADKILSTLPEKNKMITEISNIEISKIDNNINAQPSYSREVNELEKLKLPISVGNMIAEQQLYVVFKIY